MYQRTISRPVSAEGVGLHSGKRCRIILHPARVNTGVVFKTGGVTIPAVSENSVVFPLCTTLQKHGKRVRTVEHLLAAVAGLMIDNLIVECLSDEIPIMDGSALPFYILLEEAEPVNQLELKNFMRITKAVEVVDGDKWARLEPFAGTLLEARVEFDHPWISEHNSASYQHVGSSSFRNELARARTFCFIKDVEAMRANGLARGGSLSSALVLDEHGVVNDEGARFDDEPVRHKILDALGDLRLLGSNFLGRYSSFKSGHHLNGLLVQKVMTLGHFETVQLQTRPPLDPYPSQGAIISY